MNKSFIVMLLVLAGCDQSNYNKNKGEDEQYTLYPNTSVALWIDPETKCEYISTTMSAAIAPRMSRNGKQICR